VRGGPTNSQWIIICKFLVGVFPPFVKRNREWSILPRFLGTFQTQHGVSSVSQLSAMTSSIPSRCTKARRLARGDLVALDGIWFGEAGAHVFDKGSRDGGR
jgi:hypothetical protein